MSPAADNTLLYIQDATCGSPYMDMVNVDTSINGLLVDNTLYSKVAVFLNETGGPVHMEPSFNLVYQFEPTPTSTMKVTKLNGPNTFWLNMPGWKK
jgi:hypothetical protein